MDTSEQYIKMCDCGEIQRINRQLSDYDLDENAPRVVPDWFISEVGDWWFSTGSKMLWLPRQDQLQEMALKEPDKDGHIEPWAVLLHRFHAYLCEDGIFSYWDESLEQLWLAFVMKDKYNKTWNGEDWK